MILNKGFRIEDWKIEDWKIGRLNPEASGWKITKFEDFKIEDLIPKCWDGSRVLL